MKHIIQIIALTTLTTCSSTDSRLLESDKTINAIFEPYEIKDLNIVLTFFESQICKSAQIDTSKVHECYQHFFKYMETSMSRDDHDLNDIKISITAQKNLYRQIDKSTFDNIWSFGWKFESNQISRDTLRSMVWNPNGKYIMFLKEFSKENEVVKKYYDAYIMSGDISPSMTAGLLVFHEQYDISDFRIRLLIAIHYLTINDEMRWLDKLKISEPNNT